MLTCEIALEQGRFGEYEKECDEDDDDMEDSIKEEELDSVSYS